MPCPNAAPVRDKSRMSSGSAIIFWKGLGDTADLALLHLKSLRKRQPTHIANLRAGWAVFALQLFVKAPDPQPDIAGRVLSLPSGMAT